MSDKKKLNSAKSKPKNKCGLWSCFGQKDEGSHVYVPETKPAIKDAVSDERLRAESSKSTSDGERLSKASTASEKAQQHMDILSEPIVTTPSEDSTTLDEIFPVVVDSTIYDKNVPQMLLEGLEAIHYISGQLLTSVSKVIERKIEDELSVSQFKEAVLLHNKMKALLQKSSDKISGVSDISADIVNTELSRVLLDVFTGIKEEIPEITDNDNGGSSNDLENETLTANTGHSLISIKEEQIEPAIETNTSLKVESTACCKENLSEEDLPSFSLTEPATSQDTFGHQIKEEEDSETKIYPVKTDEMFEERQTSETHQSGASTSIIKLEENIEIFMPEIISDAIDEINYDESYKSEVSIDERSDSISYIVDKIEVERSKIRPQEQVEEPPIETVPSLKVKSTRVLKVKSTPSRKKLSERDLSSFTEPTTSHDRIPDSVEDHSIGPQIKKEEDSETNSYPVKTGEILDERQTSETHQSGASASNIKLEEIIRIIMIIFDAIDEINHIESYKSEESIDEGSNSIRPQENHEETLLPNDIADSKTSSAEIKQKNLSDSVAYIPQIVSSTAQAEEINMIVSNNQTEVTKIKSEINVSTFTDKEDFRSSFENATSKASASSENEIEVEIQKSTSQLVEVNQLNVEAEGDMDDEPFYDAIDSEYIIKEEVPDMSTTHRKPQRDQTAIPDSYGVDVCPFSDFVRKPEQARMFDSEDPPRFVCPFTRLFSVQPLEKHEQNLQNNRSGGENQISFCQMSCYETCLCGSFPCSPPPLLPRRIDQILYITPKCRCKSRDINDDRDMSKDTGVNNDNTDVKQKSGGVDKSTSQTKQITDTMSWDIRQSRTFYNVLLAGLQSLRDKLKQSQQSNMKINHGNQNDLCLNNAESLSKNLSTPITIKYATPIGNKSLLIVWAVSSIAEICGYEIYIDDILKCRFYTPLHDSAIVYGVDINKKHLLTLYAVPNMSLYKTGLDITSPLLSSPHLWARSQYLYEPGFSQMANVAVSNASQIQ